MAIEDHILRRFLSWEQRCRGTALYPAAVGLEPPFVRFPGYGIERSLGDDGRRDTGVSSFFSPKQLRTESEPEPEPEPEFQSPEDIAVLQVTPCEAEPKTIDLLRLARSRTAFEIVGVKGEVWSQFATSISNARRWKNTIESCLPGSNAFPGDTELSANAVVDLGLRTVVMAPLRNMALDIAAVLDGLDDDERGVYQVLFEPAASNWQTEMERAVTLDDGRPLDAEVSHLCEQKLSEGPIFAVVLRLAADASSLERAWEIIADMAGALSVLDGENGFIPLQNAGYPISDHAHDLTARLSRRPGMLLSMRELCTLITPPWKSRCRSLRRDGGRLAPVTGRTPGSVRIGINRFAGIETEVWLSAEHRVRHTHVIGASGTGKSTLLFNLLLQDLENGEGCALFDPHGDLVERVLGAIPRERLQDVVLIDPSDAEYSVGFNILAAHSELERSLLASDLISVFRRLSTSWGDQMNSVLRNAILAFLESSEGGTLLDLRRFLLDPAFRTQFLKTVGDPEVVLYWQRAFPQLSGNRSLGPIMTRLDDFLSQKPIRYMVGQRENRLDFSEIMDAGRILLVKLPQGQIGQENAQLLGSLFVSKIQQTAISRQSLKESARRNFWVYLDEFQYFITPSMAEILTGARKYRVGLVLAHQSLSQLHGDSDVSGAVLANCCNRAVFRVSDGDARSLDAGFEHFNASALQRLGVGEAICRIERSDADFNLRVAKPQARGDEAVLRAATESSRTKYSKPRAEIDEEFQTRRERPNGEPRQPAASKRPAPTPEPPSRQDSAQPESPAPKLTVETVPTPAPVQRAVADLGRGGAQHQAIQSRIKTEAERLGFRAIVEEETNSRRGSIDLALKRPGIEIACEISVSTTIDHEVGNVSKCAKAGYRNIAVICTTQDRLSRIEAAVTNSLGKAISGFTRYYLPDDFIAYLESIPAEVAATTERTSRGYKVTRNVVEMGDGERAEREKEFLGIIARNLRHESNDGFDESAARNFE